LKRPWADPESRQATETCRIAAALVADRVRSECDGFDDRQAAAAAEHLLRSEAWTPGRGFSAEKASRLVLA